MKSSFILLLLSASLNSYAAGFMCETKINDSSIVISSTIGNGLNRAILENFKVNVDRKAIKLPSKAHVAGYWNRKPDVLVNIAETETEDSFVVLNYEMTEQSGTIELNLPEATGKSNEVKCIFE